jgi:FSR family fosmidomycin resistance protein-like MFS transporter
MFMMVSFAVRSFAVVVVGAVGDMAGMENMFVFSAVVGFVSLPFLIWLPDRKKEM